VRAVRLVGGRSRGTESALSDWDFTVETDDFEAIARELPEIFAPFAPLATLWDPRSASAFFMVLLPGGVRLDLGFDHGQEPEPRWVVSVETLSRIDAHFWNWSLYLASKREKGREDLVREGLEQLASYVLVGFGIDEVPVSIERAIELYLTARGQAERRFGVAVPRQLGEDARSAISAAAGTRSRR
jgi:hypothetical protein